MQSNPGYVYVLFNPSAKGLVKIGKTTKDPEMRANELSSGTGVPTPFVVIYQAYFGDCSAAETFVHSLLQDKRVSDNKEFFRASTNEAIQAVILAERTLNKGAISESDQLNEDSLYSSELSNEICQDLLDIADAYLYGYDSDILQDYEEAIKYYLKAAKLGCSEAYRNLGNMYYYGEGVQENTNQAMNYYKEGSKIGDLYCWGKMAYIYGERKEHSNSDKCWIKSLTSPKIKELSGAEQGALFYDFIIYMNSSRDYNHHEALESYYQKLKAKSDDRELFEKTY